MFVLNKENGAIAFQSAYLGNHPHSSISVHPELPLMFVGANNGRFFAYDYEKKEETWTYKTGAEIKSTPAVAGDMLFVTSWDKAACLFYVVFWRWRVEMGTYGGLDTHFFTRPVGRWAL